MLLISLGLHHLRIHSNRSILDYFNIMVYAGPGSYYKFSKNLHLKTFFNFLTRNTFNFIDKIVQSFSGKFFENSWEFKRNYIPGNSTEFPREIMRKFYRYHLALLVIWPRK